MNDTQHTEAFLEIRQTAHTKEEINESVAKWCDNPEMPDLLKYIYGKELEQAVKIMLDLLRKPARQSYLELTKGAIEKKNLFGVEVSTQSTVKKQILAKEYIYSDTVDGLKKEIETLEQTLKDKKDLLKAQMTMEINSGTAIELTGGDEVGNEVAIPVEDSFNLVIKFRDK